MSALLSANLISLMFVDTVLQQLALLIFWFSNKTTHKVKYKPLTYSIQFKNTNKKWSYCLFKLPVLITHKALKSTEHLHFDYDICQESEITLKGITRL